MRKEVLIAILCFLWSSTFAQSLMTANELFDNFEFHQALKAYKEIAENRSLDEESQERLAYCYYITGNSSEGLPYINSIITSDDNRAHLWLWKGTLEKESRKFDEAISSLNKFKEKSSKLAYEVDVLIESCSQIPTWDTLVRHSVSSVEENNLLANSVNFINGDPYWMSEVGVDSSGRMKSVGQLDGSYAELFYMKPLIEENGRRQIIRAFESQTNLSITQMTLSIATGKMYFSASDLLNKNPILRAPQIYSGDFTSMDQPLENVSLWKYSGLNDSSSYSHPTCSPGGNLLVFSKSSKSTQGSDLFLSVFENGAWTEPQPVNEINTPGNEMFPHFTGDNGLRFSTDGRPGYGGLDIFSTTYNNNSFSEEIEHYKSPINSSMDDYSLFWEDSLNGLLVSNRNGGLGDDDVWKIAVEPIEIPPVVIDDGFDEWYEKWNMKQIYFDFDSFEAEANKEFIDGCKKYREKYGVDVKLVGHTDAQGSDDYNMELGMNRAKWLKDQLTAAEVLNVIEIDSVGEKELVNECSNGVKCSDEEHRMNRFVQIHLAIKENTVE